MDYFLGPNFIRSAQHGILLSFVFYAVSSFTIFVLSIPIHHFSLVFHEDI